MKKQTRLFPAFVALSLFLASGPLPAAAQVMGRVQIGAASGAAIPVVPTIGTGMQAGSFSNALTPGISLNGSLAAPSATLSPIASIVPTAAVAAPSALTVVTQQAAATPDGAHTLIIRTPGGAATHIAQEAAAYAEVPAANAPAAKAAAVPIEKSVAGRILDAILRRPAASISFDGAVDKGDGVEPASRASSGRFWTKEKIDALLAVNETAIRNSPGVKDVQVSIEGSLPVLVITVSGRRTISAVKKALETRVPAIQGLNGILGAPSQIRYRRGGEKTAPIFGRLGLREQKPLSLPNGSAPDEQPTTPSPDREPTTRIEAYGLPGARDVGGIFETSRKVLSADPSNATAVVEAVRAMIDADPARYGVSSADLRLIHAQTFEGKGEQADTLFVYFRQTKNGLIVNGSALSFTIKTLDARPTIVAQTGQVFPQLDVNTDTVLTDDQIMGKIAERTGMPVADVSSTFLFYEQKLVYSRGAWHNVKLYVADGVPFMVAVDVVTGLVFAWDNRTGLESFQQAPSAPNAGGVSGKISGNTVDKGPILKNSVVGEVPMPFMEVKIGAKSYVTDKNGALPSDLGLEIGPEGLELTATLSGPYVRVENQQGATLSVKVTVTPGENKVVFNPATGVTDENTLAQVNAFHKVNMSLNFLRERGLSNKRMNETQLPVRTNVNDECNAYYTPGRPSLNFFRSSRNCVNSAYDTVAEHENGHFWDDFTGGIVNGGLSEGWGDILSMFRLNNPVIGEHFLKVPRGGVDYIRHGENKYQYNEYDEVHDQGQAWGGFAWKLRKALIEKLGYDEGSAMAESLIMPTMFAKASTIPDAMAQVLVNATKKDGSILHEAEIRAAAKAHGVNLPQAASPTSSPASWLKVKVKSASIENLPNANQGLAPEAASADGILPARAEEAKNARGLVTFTAGRLVRADALSYIRGYLDHFGAAYTIRRTSGGGNGTTYELSMIGSQHVIENLTKTLTDGHLGY